MIPFHVFPQKLSNGTYWISLKDKEGNKYTLNDPSAFLSERSLERRAKQKISLSQDDLPVSQLYIDSLKSLGLNILGSSRWFNSVIIESNDTLLLDTLDQISFISEFDFKIPRKKSIPNNSLSSEIDLLWESQKNSSLDYGLSFPQISLLNGDLLHEMGYQGNGIRIAVIDGGFFMADSFAAFNNLWNEGRVLGYRDFSRSETEFFSTNSHGMSVLSTMAANIPGEIIGTAPKASYYLLKSEIVDSETPLEEAFWLLAAEYADSAGADIINSSLGYSVFDDPQYSYTREDMDGKTTLVTRAAEKAFSKGMIVVNSAGNEGNKTWKYITAPSDGPNVLSIGAIDTSGKVASFSSRGPSTDLRIKPDVLSVGYQAIVVNSLGLTTQGNGTSFSSPQIAGMIACLWEAAPEKTNKEIIEAVRRSASLYFSPNDSAGYGIPNFINALALLKMQVPSEHAVHLSIVPNPNNGIFEIRSDIYSGLDAQIEIYNLLGKKIFSETRRFSSGFIRISDLEEHNTGLYFIVVRANKMESVTNAIILKR